VRELFEVNGELVPGARFMPHLLALLKVPSSF
jgi:hypothetical protein